MGVISLDHIDNLFWLGRYAERVYATIRLYFKSYDSMIDIIEDQYIDFCKRIDIPNIYGSADAFRERYPFDETDVNSIISNLTRAYDNGIIMRELIGSETLSYIQLAMYEMQKAKKSQAPLIEMQEVLDHILSFWGILDDNIDNQQVINVIKVGKLIERIDLYARLKFSGAEILREVSRIRPCMEQSKINFHDDYLDKIESLAKSDIIDYYQIVNLIESIVINY